MKTNILKASLFILAMLFLGTGLKAQLFTQTQSTNYKHSSDAALGDIDGDGDLDAFVVNTNIYSYNYYPEVMLNDGNGTMTATSQDFGQYGFSYGVALDDFNNDGYADAFLVFNGKQPEVWLGASSGIMTLNQALTTGSNTSRKVVAGDVNGDGHPDAIVANNSNGVDVFFNNGTASFSLNANINDGGSIYDVELGDFDGDNDLDLIAVVNGDNSKIYLNDGTGNFTFDENLTTYTRGKAAVIGDMDGDNDLDIALVQESVVYIMANDGASNFTQISLIGQSYLTNASIGDLDSDGDLDLVVASGVSIYYNYGYYYFYPQNDKIWLNTGTGQFAPSQILVDRVTSACPLGDLDDDGDLDIFISSSMVFRYGRYPSLYNQAPNYVFRNNSDPGQVKFYNSQNNLQSGGVLEYREGSGSSWQTATETETGVFDVDSDAESVALRMSYGPQVEIRSNIPTPISFSRFDTKAVTVELLNKDGVRGHDNATVDYTSNGWHNFGTTGDDETGTVTQEMLPLQYTFRMDYEGGRQLQQNVDVATTQLISFQTKEVTVELLKSDNTLGHDGGVVKYNKMGWNDFGTTGDNGLGLVKKELLPVTYKFKMEYAGGKNVVSDVDVNTTQLLTFNTYETTVELRKSDNTLGLDGGDVTFGKSAPNTPFGTTGVSGLGLAKKDLLPGTYNFKMVYDGFEETSGGYDITSDPVITFNEDSFKSGDLDGNTFRIATYPNPFSNSINIGISNNKSQNASVVVYNMSGQQVAVLHDGILAEGIHKFVWDSNNQINGMYIIRFTSAQHTENKQVVKM